MELSIRKQLLLQYLMSATKIFDNKEMDANDMDMGSAQTMNCCK